MGKVFDYRDQVQQFPPRVYLAYVKIPTDAPPWMFPGVMTALPESAFFCPDYTVERDGCLLYHFGSIEFQGERGDPPVEIVIRSHGQEAPGKFSVVLDVPRRVLA